MQMDFVGKNCSGLVKNFAQSAAWKRMQLVGKAPATNRKPRWLPLRRSQRLLDLQRAESGQALAHTQRRWPVVES